MRNLRSFGLLGTIALAVCASSGALASTLGVDPDLPQVDFRATGFAAADQKHSFSAIVDGIDLTVSAFAIDANGQLSDSLLWWDSIDGLGVRGDEDDEIDTSEQLVIEFAEAIGISHIFLSDLFTDESWGGLIYDETARISLNGGIPVTVSARDIQGNTGNGNNGEGVYIIDPAVLVSSITFSVAPDAIGHQNFSVLGFVDPEVVPAPTPLAVLGLCFLALASFSRRRLRL